MSNATGIAQIAPPNAGEQHKGTRMENFEPIAGSIVVLAYDPLGEIGGVSLEVREIVSDQGGRARGALVTVKENEHRSANSFVDEDEIPELLKGFDSLLAVKANPTKFKFFEVRYETKGKFQLTAFNNMNGYIVYGVRAGSSVFASQYNFNSERLWRLKTMFESANAKLRSLEQS